jgi:hypothetical protein
VSRRAGILGGEDIVTMLSDIVDGSVPRSGDKGQANTTFRVSSG